MGGGSGGERKREEVWRGVRGKAWGDTDTDDGDSRTRKQARDVRFSARDALLTCLHPHCIQGRPSAAKRSTRDGAILSRPHTSPVLSSLHLSLPLSFSFSAPHPATKLAPS